MRGGRGGVVLGRAVGGIVNRGRVMLLGLEAGVAWYCLSVGFFWNYVNPMIPLYSRGGGMLLAHVGLGVFLGSFPRYLDALETEGGAADSSVGVERPSRRP